MVKFTLTSLLLLAGSYLGACTLLYTLQRAMLYYPTPPTTVGGVEVIRLDSGGQSLKVWHVPRSEERAILYFGGNAEDVAENIPQFQRLFPGYALYFPNYRGYGGSSGSPSEEGLFADALALYDLAARQHRDIAVIGRSLGTGVAVYLAANRPVSRLVLVTPFDSMTNVAASIYPFFPVKLLLRDRYDSLARAAGLTAETLVLVAEADEVIPRERTEALIAALKPEKTRVVVVPATGHNTIGYAPAYEKALSGFLNGNRPTDHE